MAWIEIRDGSDNLIVGLSSVERVKQFLEWLDRQDPSFQRNRRVIAYEPDGTPVTVFPNDSKELNQWPDSQSTTGHP